MDQITRLFNLDPVAILLISLVGFIGASVALFSINYMKGDSRYKTFFRRLACLIGSVFIMASADHLLLFMIAWMTSNILLAQLMIHKSSWAAAYQSGLIALRYLSMGFLCLSGSFAILYLATGETSIQAIQPLNISEAYLIPALVLLLLAAMIQSSIWPFQQWLLSSLNSPTPVSAIMHAGLINGGGVLLYRFYPLFIDLNYFLNIIFVIGILTAVLGTLWKLSQNDIKRMLACSTMSQMGFMMAQCGLGLFPAAMAHVCFHGLFKAYLFLGASSAVQDKRCDLGYPPQLSVAALSLFCGLMGGMVFSFITIKTIFPTDSHLILSIIAILAGAQFSMPLMRKLTVKNVGAALILTTGLGALYGFNVHFVETYIIGSPFLQGQPLNGIYIAGALILVCSWLLVIFHRKSMLNQSMPDWQLKTYVKLLNASQPHPDSITTHRPSYQYE